MNISKQIKTGLAVMGIAVLGFPTLVSAAPNQVVVTEKDVARQIEGTAPTKDWVIYKRIKDGTATATAVFRDGPSKPPLNTGSLSLNTPAGTDKTYVFNYNHVGTKLSDINEISYNTFRSAGSAQQVAAMNAVIDFNGPGAEGGFSTLVFEPVYNTAQGAVLDNQWQDWVGTGSSVWWSTKDINGQCAFTCYKTWNEIKASNPNATIKEGVGINQGSGNEGLVSAVDAFTFDEVTYDFEKTPVQAMTKAECKDGGFRDFQADYKNQGDCVSSVASNSNKNNSTNKTESTTVLQKVRDLIGL